MELVKELGVFSVILVPKKDAMNFWSDPDSA